MRASIRQLGVASDKAVASSDATVAVFVLPPPVPARPFGPKGIGLRLLPPVILFCFTSREEYSALVLPVGEYAHC